MNLYHVLLGFFIILTFGYRCFCDDVYISQNGTGSQDGTSVEDARSHSWLCSLSNWGDGKGLIGPGDTIHLSGVFTNRISILKSGNKNAPIRLYFEPNASCTRSVWDLNGAINANNVNNIVIDGGVNGLICNTSNGTLLPIQTNSFGIRAINCNELIIQNVTISNVYVRTPYSSDNKASGVGIYFGGSGMTNAIIRNCRIYEAETAISAVYWPSLPSCNWRIYSNVCGRVSNGITLGSANIGANIHHVYIYDNRIYGAYVWDGSWTPPPGDGHYHSDGIQGWAVHKDSFYSDIFVFGNTIGPDMGKYITGWIFFEGSLSNCMVFNNVLWATNGHAPANGFITMQLLTNNLFSSNITINNNTIVGQNYSGLGMRLRGSSSDFTVNNNIICDTATYLFLDTHCLFSSSSNVFYNAKPTMMFRIPEGFQSFFSWRASGMDTNSFLYEPPFVDRSSANFRLTPAGMELFPAIGAFNRSLALPRSPFLH